MYGGKLCGRGQWPRSLSLAGLVTRPWLATLLLLLPTWSKAVGECIDPTTLTHSTAGITSYFDDDERKANKGIIGIRGTGWFLSPTSMVTAEHVATAMRLSDQSWKQVEIFGGEGKRSTEVRILRVAGSNQEKIAVLELRSAFLGARGLEIRTQPLAPEEPVVSLAYPGNRLRIAKGRFVQYGDSEKFAGTALFEIYDGDDRLVLDHGASGAPVLDCQGRVVAVVSNLFTQTLQFLSHAIKISSAWGQPNVVSVPIVVLTDSSRVK